MRNIGPHAASNYQIIKSLVELLVGSCLHEPSEHVDPLPCACCVQTLVSKFVVNWIVEQKSSITVVRWACKTIQDVPKTDAQRH